MAWDYDRLIDELTDRYVDADIARSGFNGKRVWAESYFNGGDDHNALKYVVESMFYVLNFMIGTLAKGFYGFNGTDFALTSALNRSMGNPFLTSGDVPELTMSAIINTMLLADDYEVQYFIGLVDAYRQSIWNKPFNEEFFAALARGFE